MRLLTGVIGCYAGGESGITDTLQLDPDYGTRFGGKPVMWPDGFTGVRLANGQVGVLNGAGILVATTGRRYEIAIAPVRDYELMNRIGAYPAAAGCPYPQDFVAK